VSRVDTDLQFESDEFEYEFDGEYTGEEDVHIVEGHRVVFALTLKLHGNPYNMTTMQCKIRLPRRPRHKSCKGHAPSMEVAIAYNNVGHALT